MKFLDWFFLNSKEREEKRQREAAKLIESAPEERAKETLRRIKESRATERAEEKRQEEEERAEARRQEREEKAKVEAENRKAREKERKQRLKAQRAELRARRVEERAAVAKARKAPPPKQMVREAAPPKVVSAGAPVKMLKVAWKEPDKRVWNIVDEKGYRQVKKKPCKALVVSGLEEAERLSPMLRALLTPRSPYPVSTYGNRGYPRLTPRMPRLTPRMPRISPRPRRLPR